MELPSDHSLPKRAIYPCCANDIDEPRYLLAGLVDEIIYCDRCRPSVSTHRKCSSSLPSVHFVRMDFRKYVDTLPLVHVLFYRRDSTGEGGSGLYILGKRWLGRILNHFPEEGGLIVTDGSNSGGGIFRRMIRPNGYTRKSWDCHLRPSGEQPWLDTHGLYQIQIKRFVQSRPVAE
jgi:hypothetical protein